MDENQTKPDAKAQAKAEAERKEAEFKALSELVGRTFTDGVSKANIIALVGDKGLGAKRGPAYLINTGNPHRCDYVFCEDFKQSFTTEVKG